MGAQIIGESLGAQTQRSPNKEIGVFPIHLTHDGEQDPVFKMFPHTFDVMHWHNDMPGLSEKAVLLAYSEGCPRQAIRYSDRVYGLQFHMEMTTPLVQGMIENCASDITADQYVQTASTLLSANLTEINQKMFLILDHLATFVKEKVYE